MAKYKVWLTVKDSYGKVKEIDGGDINIDLQNLSPSELAHIEEALPLEDYIKRENLDIELDHFATEDEVQESIQQNTTIRYEDFEFED